VKGQTDRQTPGLLVTTAEVKRLLQICISIISDLSDSRSVRMLSPPPPPPLLILPYITLKTTPFFFSYKIQLKKKSTFLIN